MKTSFTDTFFLLKKIFDDNNTKKDPECLLKVGRLLCFQVVWTKKDSVLKITNKKKSGVL